MGEKIIPNRPSKDQSAIVQGKVLDVKYYEPNPENVFYKSATISMSVTNGPLQDYAINIEVGRATDNPNIVAKFNVGDTYSLRLYGPDKNNYYIYYYCESPIPLEKD